MAETNYEDLGYHEESSVLKHNIHAMWSRATCWVAFWLFLAALAISMGFGKGGP